MSLYLSQVCPCPPRSISVNSVQVIYFCMLPLYPYVSFVSVRLLYVGTSTVCTFISCMFLQFVCPSPVSTRLSPVCLSVSCMPVSCMPVRHPSMSVHFMYARLSPVCSFVSCMHNQILYVCPSSITIRLLYVRSSSEYCMLDLYVRICPVCLCVSSQSLSFPSVFCVSALLLYVHLSPVCPSLSS